MARVFVVAREALAVEVSVQYMNGQMWLTIVLHWVRDLVSYRSWRFDGEAGPLLHGSTVNSFAIMLECNVS